MENNGNSPSSMFQGAQFVNTPQPVPSVQPVPPVAPPTQPVYQEAYQDNRGSGGSFFLSFAFWGPLIFFLNLATIFWFLIYPRIANVVEIPSQSALSSEVKIDRLVVKERAALLIWRPSSDSPEGTVIGETGVFLPGTYKDFGVPVRILDDATGETVKLTPGLARAILYKDVDNSGSFNSEIDTEPLKDLFGNSIMTEFVFQ